MTLRAARGWQLSRPCGCSGGSLPVPAFSRRERFKEEPPPPCAASPPSARKGDASSPPRSSPLSPLSHALLFPIYIRRLLAHGSRLVTLRSYSHLLVILTAGLASPRWRGQPRRRSVGCARGPPLEQRSPWRHRRRRRRRLRLRRPAAHPVTVHHLPLPHPPRPPPAAIRRALSPRLRRPLAGRAPSHGPRRRRRQQQRPSRRRPPHLPSFRRLARG